MSALFTKWTAFTHAVVRGVPSSVIGAVSLANHASTVHVARAKSQLDVYTQALKRCGVDVISLSADEAYPDCCFVEDTAVVIGHTALLSRPKLKSRRGEVAGMRKTLETLPLNLMEIEDDQACVEGGDVLFTGREILVGLSERTNSQALTCLAQAFPAFPVIGIPIDRGMLHLKSCATLAAPDTLVWGGSRTARAIRQEFEKKSAFKYTTVQLHADEAANLICVNGHILHKPESSIGSLDYQILKELFQGRQRHEVDFDELYKIDGCLTCCTVLINLKGEDLNQE